ncbi:MAG TPA: ABC transporter substrate-binding protein [Stellaceae bacterium]|nr:ABC transporter substrate-binding protein [Stellaceae bacterium]
MAWLKKLVIAAALVAAGTGAAMAQTTLKIGLQEDPDILDPTLGRTFVGRIIFASVCDKLFDITPDLKIVPQLATGYKWGDDGKSLTITLRQGVVFHDGEPMNAAAVKATLERYLTFPASTRKVEISAIQGIDVVDDHTVKLALAAPFSPLVAALADRAGMILSPKAAAAEGDKFGNHPVCAGPYKFVERVAQDRIVVEKFDKYWDKDKIHIDKIVFQPIPDNSVRVANLRSGGLDLTERLLPTDLEQVKGDSNLQVASIGEIGYLGITVNTDNGPQSKNPLGQDPRIRQALSLSIDREALNQVVFNGQYIPGNQWVTPGTPYYDKNYPVPKRDVAKAKALLKEAGVEHPSFTLMIPNNTEQQQVGQVIQAMAGEAGFDVKLQATEFASALKLSTDGTMQAFQIGWSGRIDPDGNLYTFVACGAALNDGHYCNPTVDEELKAARAVDDPAERMKHYDKAAGILLTDLPIIYLYHRKLIFAFNKKVTGFTPYPDGLIRPQGLALK